MDSIYGAEGFYHPFSSGLSSPPASELTSSWYGNFSSFLDQPVKSSEHIQEPDGVPLTHQPQPQRQCITANITEESLMHALEDLIEEGALDSFLQENAIHFEQVGITPSLLSHDDASPALKTLPPQYNRQRRHSISTPGTGELKKCPFPGCGKVFDRTYNLHSHIKVHYSDRPHQCLHCDVSFTRRHDLRRHMKIHTAGEESAKITCPRCGKTFSRRDALSRHLRLLSCHP